MQYGTRYDVHMNENETAQDKASNTSQVDNVKSHNYIFTTLT